MLLTALFVGWASIAAAWTYSAGNYDYIGVPPLRGTIPGATYVGKAGVITNNSATTQLLTVDLYYGDFYGKYQYSLNSGFNWSSIDQNVTTWTRNVASGSNIWIRVVLLDSSTDLIYHILSTAPYGEADETLGDAYYFAFSPNAYYYSDFSTREVGISGYVAVVKE